MNYKLLTAIFFITITCSCQKTSKTEEDNSYKLIVVKRESRTLTSEYSARLRGSQEVEIRPQVSGLITRICINEGDKVKRGQTLFIIDQVPYKAALAEADANVRSAEAHLATSRLNYESAVKLREKNVVQDYDVTTARNELSAAKAALALAQAQQLNARNNLSYTEVKSPVDGVAGMIAYRVGALVGSSITQPLVTVSDNSRIYAYFSLSEREAADIIGQYGTTENFLKNMPDVTLKTIGGAGDKHVGRISAVSGIVDASTGVMTMRADFNNPEGKLRAGGNGTVIIPTVKRQCIVIPQTATYELQNKTFAYIVKSGKAQAVPLTLYAINNGKEYVVESGLAVGDTIIAEGAGLVKEGAKVSVSR